MAQTSVEWLVEKIKDEEIIIYHGLFDRWVEQAKAMHKEECENAWMDGFDFNSNYKDFEDYYNKTYNK